MCLWGAIDARQKLISSNDLIPANVAPWFEFLEPWISHSAPINSMGWRREKLGDYLHLKGKIIKRNVKHFVSGKNRSSSDYRTSDHVKKTYGETWSTVDWPKPHKPQLRRDRTLAEWRGKGLIMGRAALSPVQLDRIMHVINLTKPARVLEVGAGMGMNLLTLAGAFPDIEFTGLELTQEGVARAKSVQEEAQLPDVIRAFSPREIRERAAHRKINFLQGDATDQPFDDNHFDLVFSRLAVEQMELVRDNALSEMVRVSAHAVLMVEPFADFNTDPHRALAIRAKNYFSLSTTDVQRYGLTLQAVYGDWTQKISEGIGLAYYTLK